MRLNQTSPVPNVFFDKHICQLSGSAVRVYLKIIRNLLGWRDADGNVKERDWIAHSQFEKTGLSNRSVTNGINELLEHRLINVTDYLGNDLKDTQKRKRAKRVYYALILENSEKTALQTEKKPNKPQQNLLTTKETQIPKYTANEKIPDSIRIRQIREQEQRKQLQRDSW